MGTRWGFRVTACVGLLALLPACGGGGGGGGRGARLSGVASLGTPLALAAVTVKDRTGHETSSQTDAQGRYSVAVSGFSAPFLVRVTDGGANTLYSIGTSAGSQRLNVHVYSDLVVKVAFATRNLLDVDTAFAGSGAAWPNILPAEVAALSGQIRGAVAPIMVASGAFSPAQASTYDLLHGPLAANETGFDRVLHYSSWISSGTGPVTYTLTSTANPPDGSQTVTTGALVASTDLSGSVSVTAKTSYYPPSVPKPGPGILAAATPDSEAQGGYDAVLPQTPEAAAAVAGIQSQLDVYAATVNARGGALSSTHLFPLYFPAYDPAIPTPPPFFMHDGDDRDVYAGAYAQFLRGKTIVEMRIDQVLAMDLAATLPWVKVRVTRFMIDEQWSTDEVFGYDAGAAAWKFYGNQRFWRQNWTELAQSRWERYSFGPELKEYQVRPGLHGWCPSTGNTGNNAEDVLDSSAGNEPTFQLGADPARVLTWFLWGQEQVQAAPLPAAPLTYYKDGWEESPPFYTYDPALPGDVAAYLAVGGVTCTVQGKILRAGLPVPPGTVQSDVQRIRGVTTEFVDPFVSIDGGPPAAGSALGHDAAEVDGKTLTVTWANPKTFVAGAVMIGCSYSMDGGATWDYVSGARTLVGGAPVNEGTVTVPAGISQCSLDFWIMGINGEAVAFKNEWNVVP